MNFVCAAKSRNLDLSPVLVFATDVETKELAEGLGLTAFFDETVRPSDGKYSVACIYGGTLFVELTILPGVKTIFGLPIELWQCPQAGCPILR